jgi:signal transduction histidine kinase
MFKRDADDWTIVENQHVGKIRIQATGQSLFNRHLQGFGEVMNTEFRSNRFIVILGHELRSSLTAIRSALDKWRERAPSELDDLRHLIERQLRVLTRLSEDLLSSEKSDDLHMALNPSSVQLGRILAVSVEQSHPLLEQRAQRLSFGAIDQSLKIQGDTDRLIQVFSNLLQNASKFTPIEGSVCISLQAENKNAVVRILDTGKGISPNELDSIFENGTVPEGCCYAENDGLGVGLDLVRTIVSAHGGTITSKSDGAGLGSEFIVKLPLISPIAHGACET